uniref:non-specific serine/threonine protein kinase n=1 Tax=Globisporangium ultimum (strain ATCC 200006 / CBS 805.95 / DAOM BR144) TaxID=431595 RepID=K3WMA1_GLOUD
MGCVHSSAAADASWPNLFQRNLCLHHKMPASEVYTVVGELGKGAFGIVEKVVHNQTKKHFAMKTVTFASGSKRHEFEKEIDILRGLHHPNIVRMVETFEDDRHFYIIMELCTTGTLLDKVKARGCEHPEDEVLVIITKLASVVQYLHSRFICHRDLKLENILVESQELGGCIKLCDFGASTLFRMGVHMCKVLGSVVYMAPEVLEGNYTHACDLWSLGVVMYMLLSNAPPFHGSTEDELTERIFEAKVVFEGPVWDGVSADAKSLIKKLLNPDPATRYSATQVLKHPWIKSSDEPVAPEVYDEFIPRVKAFCQYSALQRAALVAFAFCMPSAKIRKHSEVYNELNVAHNGILTLQELQDAPALKRFALDMDKIYRALDQQHEKGVNLLEFVAATLNADDVSNEETLRTAFRIFDRKNTGGITHQNLMTLLGQHFDAAACQEMVKRADADKDGKIGFEDFAKMMKVSTKLRILVLEIVNS